MGRKRANIRCRYHRCLESRDEYLRRLEDRRTRSMLCGAYTLGLARPDMEYQPMVALYGKTDLSKLFSFLRLLELFPCCQENFVL